MRSLVLVLLMPLFPYSVHAQKPKNLVEALRYCAKLKEMLPACKKLEVDCAAYKQSCKRSMAGWVKERASYEARIKELEDRVIDGNRKLEAEIKRKPTVLIRKEIPGWVLPVVIVGGVVLLGAGVGIGIGVAVASGIR